MAFAYFQYVNAGIDQDKNIKNAEHFVRKAFSLNSDLAEAHFVMGCIYTLSAEPDKAMEHALLALKGKPDDPEMMLWTALGYCLVGWPGYAKSLIEKCLKIDPVNPLNSLAMGWNLFFSGRYDLALDPIVAACDSAPKSRMNQFWKSLILFYNKRLDEAYDFICLSVEEPATDSWSQLSVFLKYVIKGEKDKMSLLQNAGFIKIHQLDPLNSYLIAAFYSHVGKKKKSLEWLENAFDRGFLNYKILNEYDPFLAEIHEEERFKKLMKKVKQRWESFEVYCGTDYNSLAT
jgi:tetratricopeptide (TPR) repeat protein